MAMADFLGRVAPRREVCGRAEPPPADVEFSITNVSFCSEAHVVAARGILGRCEAPVSATDLARAAAGGPLAVMAAERHEEVRGKRGGGAATARPVAMLCGVDRDGRSVLARVRGFEPVLRLVRGSDRLVPPEALAEACLAVDSWLGLPPGSTRAARKPAYRLYGWHYPSHSPGERRRWNFYDVRVPTTDTRMAERVLRSKLEQYRLDDIEIHEHTLSLDGVFFEAIRSAPNRWVRARAVSRDQSRVSVRVDEFDVRIEDVQPCLDAAGAEPKDLAPQLLVYADLECAAERPGMFPSAAMPTNEITAFGMTFVWALGIPAPLACATPDADRAAAAELECEEYRRAAERESIEDVARVRAARERRRRVRGERRQARAQKIERLGGAWSDPSLRADLDSASESEGSAREDERAARASKKRADESCALSRARLGGRPWRGGDPRGTAAGHPFLRIVLVNGAGFDAAAAGGTVRWVPERHLWMVWLPDERAMMEAARQIAVLHMDVDGWRWYNGNGFDLPYLLERASLRKSNALMIAKCLCNPPTIRARPQNSIGMMDVGCVDLMQFVREMFGQSMEGVRLENFCRHFGVPGKAGIKYSEITRAFIEKDAGVTEQVALYCAEDCDALCRAATASGAETTIAEFARLVGMNSDAMWTSGQSARFVYLVARQSHALGFVMDWINETMRRFGALFGLYDAAPHAAAPAKRPAPDEPSAAAAAAAATTTTTKGYKGATVLEPKTGFRGTYPMCTGDFQSLYPSIMRGMGICFSTLVLGGTDEARSLARAGVRLMRIQVSSEGEPEKHQWFVQPQVLVDQHIDGSRALFDQRWCGLRLPPGQSRRPHDAKLDGAAVQPSVWAQSSETWSDDPVPPSGGGAAAAVAFPRSPRLTQMYAQQQAAVLPALEEMLFNMRADVKKQMGKEPKGSIGYAVLNTRQDAIKRMMNSIYGGTGLINGPYMCVPVAESITSTGRSLIVFSKNFVETYPFQKLITFRRAGSADTDWITQEYDPAAHDDASAFADRAHPPLQKPCEVIYGDTDSIMFVIYIPDRFLHDDMVKGCFAKSVADFLLERLNECFPKPITIVNEQIAFRFFLKGKKMYANMYKENPKSKSMSQKVKGLAMVRRDWPEIAKRTQERCVDRILNHKEGVAAALRTATRAIFAVLDRSLPIEDYVITQELKKISASPQEHVTAAYAMNRIDRSKNFGKGDRVPYVITTRSDPARLNVPKDFLSSTAPIHDDDDDAAAAAAAAAATTKDASKDQAKKLCTRSRCIGDPDASLDNIDSHYYIEILRSPLEMFFKEDPRSMATLQHAFSFALARSKDGAGAGASSAPSMSILDIMRRRKAQLEAAAAAAAAAGGSQ